MPFAIFSLSYQVCGRNHMPFFQLYHPPPPPPLEPGRQTIYHILRQQTCISSPLFTIIRLQERTRYQSGRVYPFGYANFSVAVISRLLIHKIHHLFLFISPHLFKPAIRSMISSTIFMNHSTLKNLVHIGEIVTFHFFPQVRR
jgi:hypothetical protein